MPDLRTTALLDDFARPNEVPIVNPPWANADTSIWQTPRLIGQNLTGPPGTSVGYWTLATFSGDVEVWGRCGPGIDLTESWRIALLTQAGGSGAVDGYLLIIVSDGGSANWGIRKYTNAGFTDIATSFNDFHPNDNIYILFRRNGTKLQAFHASHVDLDTWTQVFDVTDTTYTTNMQLALGVDSDDGANPGWEAFGGGVEDFIPQIYRRPTE